MAINTEGQIVAPVGVSEVASVIGASSTDVGTLCTHPNINKWAASKPQHHASLDPTGDWRKPNSDYRYGLYVGKNKPNEYFFDKTKTGSNMMDGVALPNGYYNLNADTSSFAYKLAFGGLKDWEYERPKGGSASPYRLGDFRNYLHSAKSPLNSPKAKHIVSYKNAQVQNVPITLGSDNTDIVGAIKIDDLLSYTDGTGNYVSIPFNYIGLLFYNNFGKAFWVTTSKYGAGSQLRNTIPLKNGTNLSNGEIQIENEVWRVKTFISTIDLGISGAGGGPVNGADAYYLSGDGEGKYMTTLSGAGFNIVVSISTNQHKLGVTIDNLTMDDVVVSSIEYGVYALDGSYDKEGNITQNIPKTIPSGGSAKINKVSNTLMLIEGDNARVKVTISGIKYTIELSGNGDRTKEEFFEITT